MKRLIYILGLFLSFCLNTQAQISFEDFEDGTSQYAFNERTRLLKVSVGLPSLMREPTLKEDYYYRLEAQSPSIYLSSNSCLGGCYKDWGFGWNFGLGINRYKLVPDEAKYSLAKASRKGLGKLEPLENDKLFRYTMGADLSFHKSFSTKLEAYISVGAFFSLYSEGVLGFFNEFEGEGFDNLLWFRTVAGVRYVISGNFGIFAEGGYDTSFLRVGISF